MTEIFQVISTDGNAILMQGQLQYLQRIQATILDLHGVKLFAKKYGSVLIKEEKSSVYIISETELNNEFQRLLSAGNLDIAVLRSTSFGNTEHRWTPLACEGVRKCIKKIEHNLPQGKSRGFADNWETIVGTLQEGLKYCIATGQTAYIRKVQ